MSKPKQSRRAISGVLLIDKPYKLSSNQALQKARWLLNAQKAGHTGVLDPLATGLLPICLGEATKFSAYLLDADKTYEATLAFGQTTTTGDAEGEICRERPITFTQSDLLLALSRFHGPILQTPPMYSALKHQGKPLYEYARQGITLERAARQVHIHAIDLLQQYPSSITLRVCCSKGTYIRTLAEDLGEALGCGAHLSALRRTHTGGFSIQQSLSLDALEAMTMEERECRLLPTDQLVSHLPKINLSTSETWRFQHGQTVRFSENYEIMQRLRVYDSQNNSFIGLGEVKQDALYPLRLLATANAVGSLPC